MNPTDYNLIEKYLDSTTTPEEFAVIEGRLRTDPALRLALLQEAGFECQLRVLLKSAAVAETPVLTDADQNATSQPGKIISWRPAWLWIPVAAAAAALIAALVAPLFPAHPEMQLADRGTPDPKRTDAEVFKTIHPSANEGVALNKSTTSAASFTSSSIPAKTSGYDIPMPADRIIAQQNSILDNRVARTQPEHPLPQPPQPPPMINPVVVASGAAQPAHAGDFSGNTVVLVRPNGAQPTENNHGGVVAPTPAAVVAAASKPAAIMPSSYGQIVSVIGNAFLTGPAEDGRGRHGIQAGENILPGDVLDTGSASAITLRYTDGTLTRLYSDTHLTLNQVGRNRNLFLASGAIDLRVQSQAAGNNLTVSTSYLEARVVGAEFRVMTDGNGSWVGVKDGRVQVVRSRANGEVVMLDAGYFASAAKGGTPTSTHDPLWRSKCQAFIGNARSP